MIDKLRALAISRPSDYELREVLADALLAANDPRGELIQMQIALTRRVPPNVREHAEQRSRELLAKHESEWTGAITAWAEVRMRGGFVEAIQSTMKAFLEHGARLLASEPVRSLTLTSVGNDQLKAFPKVAGVDRIEQLRLRGNYTHTGISELLRAPQLKKLQRLTLSSAGTSALGSFQGGALTNLSSLCLTSCEVGDEGVEILANARELSSLTSLFLTRTGLSDEAAKALAGSRTLTRLEVLTLGGNEELGDEGVEALAKSRNFESLRLLEINQTGVSDAAAQAIAKSKTMGSLRRVDVRQTEIGSKGLAALKRRPGVTVKEV